MKKEWMAYREKENVRKIRERQLENKSIAMIQENWKEEYKMNDRKDKFRIEYRVKLNNVLSQGRQIMMTVIVVSFILQNRRIT